MFWTTVQALMRVYKAEMTPLNNNNKYNPRLQFSRVIGCAADKFKSVH